MNNSITPAVLERIRQYGILESRIAHKMRMDQVERFKAEPALLFDFIRPSLSTSEAVEDARKYLAWFRNQPAFRQRFRNAERAKNLRKLLYARYFRRFGKRIWVKQ